MFAPFRWQVAAGGPPSEPLPPRGRRAASAGCAPHAPADGRAAAVDAPLCAAQPARAVVLRPRAAQPPRERREHCTLQYRVLHLQRCRVDIWKYAVEFGGGRRGRDHRSSQVTRRKRLLDLGEMYEKVLLRQRFRLTLTLQDELRGRPPGLKLLRSCVTQGWPLTARLVAEHRSEIAVTAT
eukprot:3148488-Prymnesium_polylepis.1